VAERQEVYSCTIDWSELIMQPAVIYTLPFRLHSFSVYFYLNLDDLPARSYVHLMYNSSALFLKKIITTSYLSSSHPHPIHLHWHPPHTEVLQSRGNGKSSGMWWSWQRWATACPRLCHVPSCGPEMEEAGRRRRMAERWKGRGRRIDLLNLKKKHVCFVCSGFGCVHL